MHVHKYAYIVLQAVAVVSIATQTFLIALKARASGEHRAFAHLATNKRFPIYYIHIGIFGI